MEMWGLGRRVQQAHLYIVDPHAQLRLDVIGADHGNIDIRRAEGSSSAPSALLSGDEIGSFSVRGYGNTGYADHSATIMFNAIQDWTDSAQGTSMTVYTTKYGTVGDYIKL